MKKIRMDICVATQRLCAHEHRHRVGREEATQNPNQEIIHPSPIFSLSSPSAYYSSPWLIKMLASDVRPATTQAMCPSI